MTDTLIYHYDIGTDEKPTIVRVERRFWRTAYARNGNAHNPTRYYRWSAYLDDALIGSSFATRREAYEAARQAHSPTPQFAARTQHPISGVWRTENVRPYNMVNDEMKSNERKTGNEQIGQLEQAFPLARPRPSLTTKPTGPRLHPSHLHDVDGYGPSCLDAGCPRWCWSGHSMSYGDDTPNSPNPQHPDDPRQVKSGS